MENGSISKYSDMISAAESGYALYRPTFGLLSRSYLSKFERELLTDLEDRRKSHIFIPQTYGKTGRLVAMLAEAYFSTDTFASLSSKSQNPDTEEKIQALQKAFDYYTDNMNLYISLLPCMLYGVVFGTSQVTAYWDGEMPRIQSYHVDDFWYDPSAAGYDSNKYFVVSVYLTVDDIKRYSKQKVFTASIDEINTISPNAEISGVADNHYKRARLYEVYENIGDSWYVTTIYDKNLILREKVLLRDGLPVVSGGMVPQMYEPNETKCVRSYFDSPIAPLLPLQLELNILRNQQIDAIGENINPSYIVDKGAGIKQKDLKGGSGRLISADNINGIKEVKAPNPAIGQIGIQQTEKEMTDAVGLADFGSSSVKQNDTATGASIIANEASIINQAKLRCYNETFFEPLMKRIALLVWKYGDERFFVGINRDEDIDFKVSVNTGVGATNKQVQKQGLNEAFAMFMQVQDFENARKIIKETLPLLGIKNVDEFFPEKEVLGAISGEQTESGMPVGTSELAGMGLAAGSSGEQVGEPVSGGAERGLSGGQENIGAQQDGGGGSAVEAPVFDAPGNRERRGIIQWFMNLIGR